MSRQKNDTGCLDKISAPSPAEIQSELERVLMSPDFETTQRSKDFLRFIVEESLFILDGIGYLLTLLGDWEKGTSLIRKVMQRNPFYSHYVHYALWVDWIHQENYERAQTETLYFKKPSFFWEALMQAVTLGQLGRYEEGKRAVAALLKLKPDFPERGRILINHDIKFNKIVDRIVEGLEKVDLKLG
jgi:hypothetical protein